MNKRTWEIPEELESIINNDVTTYRRYIKVKLSDVKTEINKVMLIPLSKGEEVFLFKDGEVFPPYKSAASELVVPKTVKSLGKEGYEFVAFTPKKIIGTNEEIFCEYYNQPRILPKRWLIVYKLGKNYRFAKSYAHSIDFKDFVIKSLIKDMPLNKNLSSRSSIEPLATLVFKYLLVGVFNYRTIYTPQVKEHFDEKVQQENSILLNYKINKFLKRGLKESK